jgi:hypothetical protein
MRRFVEHYVRGLGMATRNNGLSVAAVEIALSRGLHETFGEVDPEER